MPYAVVPVGSGYKVMSPDGRTFSRKPLSKKRAEKQRVAIALSEARKTHQPAAIFF